MNPCSLLCCHAPSCNTLLHNSPRYAQCKGEQCGLIHFKLMIWVLIWPHCCHTYFIINLGTLPSLFQTHHYSQGPSSSPSTLARRRLGDLISKRTGRPTFECFLNFPALCLQVYLHSPQSYWYFFFHI